MNERETPGNHRGLRLCYALREALRQGYDFHDFRADLLAGVVVGIVAVPLAMALAIACGIPPKHGLYTAIVAGGLTALLGGSRVQVSGPTAAFVVILAPISARFGIQGLALATAMAGVMLITMGALRFGRFVELIPYPVTIGFTAGIGTVIATLQIQDFFGLTVEKLGAEAHYVDRVVALAKAFPTLRVWDLVTGAVTLAILFYWRRVKTRLPAPLVALSIGALLGWVVEHFVADSAIATLAERFGTRANPSGIPQVPPAFGLPWILPGPGGGAGTPLSLELMQTLLPAAFAIAMLGAIESLLSAVVADGMSGHKHDPDAELFALGVANVAAPFLGGIAATGAIARTATNVRSGARSPIAAIVHAFFVLIAVLALAPLLGYLPLASLSALLLVVAWNMSELRHVRRMIERAPKSDVAVLASCFALTVLFDMTIAVAVGMALAAVLFMKEMIELSGSRLIGGHHPEFDVPLPKGLVVYEVLGPMFFGAAHKATSQINAFDRKDTKIVLMEMSNVPAVDATGIVNLESAIDRLKSVGIEVVLTGLQSQPIKALAKAGVIGEPGRIASYPRFQQGLAAARAKLETTREAAPKENPAQVPGPSP